MRFWTSLRKLHGKERELPPSPEGIGTGNVVSEQRRRSKQSCKWNVEYVVKNIHITI